MWLLFLVIAILLLLAIAIGREIICLLKGHRWSQWHNQGTQDKQYRYCIRCSEIEHRIGLMVVKANPKERFRTICNRFIRLGKPSFEVEMRRTSEEALRDWYYHIPRDVLNDGIKCLANKMREKSFDLSRFRSFSFFLDCSSCQNYCFCEDIIRSMQKVFKKYERKEKVRLREDSKK